MSGLPSGAGHRRLRSHSRQPSAQSFSSRTHQRIGSLIGNQSSQNSDVVKNTIKDKFFQDTLARNEVYDLTLLIERLHKSLRSDDGIIAGYIDSESGHALLLSEQAAYIFPFRNQSKMVEPPTLTFPLPRENTVSLQTATTSYPLACLTSPNAGSNEPGLLIVMPITGRVAYWDSIGSAAVQNILSPKGVESKVPLATNEVISHLSNIEPAGFVLSTTSGKLIQLQLRDGFGRPAISISNINAYGIGGFLGSLAGTLKGATLWRDIQSIRAGNLISRSERNFIIATERGIISEWTLSRVSSARLIYEANVRSSLLDSLANSCEGAFSAQAIEASFRLHDCSTPPSGNKGLLLLGSFYYQDSVRFFAAYFASEFAQSETPQVSTYILRWYSQSVDTETFSQCRLLASPKSPFVGLIFPDSLVFLQAPRSVDELWCNEILVALHRTDSAAIIASGIEDSSRDDGGSSIISVTKSIGVLKCDLTPSRIEPWNDQYVFRKLLESAVYYSGDHKTPQVPLSTSSILQTALKLSKDILNCENSLFENKFLTLKETLAIRTEYLNRLNQNLLSNFPQIDDAGRIELSMYCEKAVASMKVWESVDAGISLRADQASVLFQIIKEMATNEGLESSDPVRDWFLFGANHIGALISRSHQLALDAARTSIADPGRISNAVVEANEIILAWLSSAHQYRSQRRTEYDHLKRPIVNGIRLWTTTVDIVRALPAQHELTQSITHGLVNGTLGLKKANNSKQMDVNQLVSMLTAQLVQLTHLNCVSFLERLKWCEMQSDPQYATEAGELRETYESLSKGWITSLAKFGKSKNAFAVAEEFQNYPALVELCYQEQNRDSLGGHDYFVQQVDFYIRNYGESFALTVFKEMVARGHLKDLLRLFPQHKHLLTKYLEINKLSKIAWIHKISLGEYAKAANALESLAADTSCPLNTAKIDLSIAKLCKLQASSSGHETNITQTSRNLDAVSAQETLLEIVSGSGTDQKDDEKAVAEASKHYMHNINPRSVYSLLIRQSVQKLLSRQRMTTPEILNFLIFGNEQDRYRNNVSFFYVALRILSQLSLPDSDYDTDPLTFDSNLYRFYESSLWRRLYLCDDWVDICDTLGKSDADNQQAARGSIFYWTISEAYLAGLFDTSSTIMFKKPSDMENDDCSSLVYDTLTYLSGSEQRNLASEIDGEQKRLREVSHKVNLDAWIPAIVLSVKESIKEASSQHQSSSMNLFGNSTPTDLSMTVDT